MQHDVENRGVNRLSIDNVQIDDAITQAFIAALEPAKRTATVTAAGNGLRRIARRCSSNGDLPWSAPATKPTCRTPLSRCRLREPALRAAVSSGESEPSLNALEAAKADPARREAPHTITQLMCDRLLGLGLIFSPSGTPARPRRAIGRSCCERSSTSHHQSRGRSLYCALDTALERQRAGRDRSRFTPIAPPTIRTDTALLRCLTVHYPSAMIARILNQRGHTTANGHRFDRDRVGNFAGTGRPRASKKTRKPTGIY